MSSAEEIGKVVDFPNTGARKASSQERIWGKAVLRHGYTGIPSILIQAQSRLGVTPARDAALGRAVLPQHPAGPALRDPETVADMIDALAPARGA